MVVDVPNGMYMTVDGNFVGVLDGEIRWQYGLGGEYSTPKTKMEGRSMSGKVESINGVKPQFTVKVDGNGIIHGMPLLQAEAQDKKNWAIWNHEISVRDNLALLERGNGLIGFTIDGYPACAFFDKDGVFKIDSKMSYCTSTSVKYVAEFLVGRVGEFYGF